MTDDIIKQLRERVDFGRDGGITWFSPDNIATLLDRLDKAERENERLRADAARYRWLRGDACPDHSVRWTQWEVRCWRSPVWSYDLRRQELDQAIDDARAAEEKKE